MKTRLLTTLSVLGLMAALQAGAETTPPSNPATGLSIPPANAQKFTILSTGGTHGHGFLWVDDKGVRHSRDSLQLRGMVTDLDEADTLGADGMLQKMQVRGVTPSGDASEDFEIKNGIAHWKSQIDEGSSPYSAPAMYTNVNGTFESNAGFVEALLKSKDHSLALLPGGRARIAPLTKLTIGTGDKTKTVVAYAVTGLSNAPFAVWATEDDHFFGFIGGLAALPEGYEDALAALNKAQDEALAKQSPAIAAQFPATLDTVVFHDVKTYDSVHLAFVEHQTVIVKQGRIVATGPASRIKVPKGAKLIEGAGHTLVPGLWDSHMHVSDDFSGPMLLSLGMTSARDPGNDNALTLARAKRRAEGNLLMPHVYASVLIDGKGPNTAQIATVATSQAEAIKEVDQAKKDGFLGVKFYGTFDPAWVKPAAAEAHKLGLHVHGHVPAGMRPREAIESGYDEITHIYFVMMQAMPQDVVDHSNGIQRFNGIGRYAKNVDLNAEPMKSLIALMAKKHITSDPTLVVPESVLSAENGKVSPAYAAYTGTLPPATERSFKSGGFAVPEGLTRKDFQASAEKLAELVQAMHKAGVPIVAGTDGSGLELVHELEIYVAHGMSPAEALQTATLQPAKLVGKAKETGSITVGKAADLVLVEGDPSKRIGDLRNTRWVMMDGRLMDADQLRTVSGVSGRPHN